MLSDATPPPAAPSLTYRLFCGVDIAAETFTTAWQAVGGLVSPPITLPQTPGGYTQFQQQLGATAVPAAQTLVVMEATGTYWMRLATTLHGAGYAVSVINPAQAHAFAKALLKRAKTDAIDAQTLTELAARLQPACWTPPPAVYAQVQQRLAERDDLVALRQQVRNQLHALIQQPVVVDAVRARKESLIATLTKQIKAVDAELVPAFAQDEAWDAAFTRLQTIPGVGLVTAAWLVLSTNNFTSASSPEAVAAYAGLVPMPRESGRSVHGRARIGRAGNARLRRACYMAAVSALRFNPTIQAFYQRLRATGKPAKVALCAAARKLIHLAWAIGTHERAFDPAYQPHRPSKKTA